MFLKISVEDLDFHHSTIHCKGLLGLSKSLGFGFLWHTAAEQHKVVWGGWDPVLGWELGLGAVARLTNRSHTWHVLYSIVCKNHSKSIGIWRCWRGWKWWKPIQSTCLWTQPSSGSRQGRNVIFLYQFYIVQPSMLEPWVLVWVCVHTYCILRWVHPWL